ncbi:MAG TPA: DUF72 domain-containing protein [Pseudomonadales bacterium]|nr:DUF72 domain-containing protein [Pseudomonadales bacterium]
MHWYSGTSGYSYKEWKGSFYPDDLAADAMLAYYAQKLPAVEINNTFYQMPRSNVLGGWADAVPPSFRFIIKASKRITHQQRLVDCADSVKYLVERIEVLGDKLGGVLYQLPPFIRKDMARLTPFLDVLPAGIPTAMEFRHVSWFDDEVLDALAAKNIALCVSDDGELELPARVATTNWVYLRLRQEAYDDKALAGWLDRANASSAATGYAFFKHEDDGAGPELAARFLTLANGPTVARKAPQRAASAVPKRATASKRASPKRSA